MDILYDPIVAVANKKIEYKFEGEKIIAILDNTTDTFDFSAMQDGKALVTEIETILPINPIISAERTNGVLSIVLLNYIGSDATEEEKFPDWQEV